MNLKLYCLKCGTEHELEFTIQNFKKFLLSEDNYICLKCTIELHQIKSK